MLILAYVNATINFHGRLKYYLNTKYVKFLYFFTYIYIYFYLNRILRIK